MKRYFESHVDLSEIEYMTTNEEQISRANDVIAELELLNGKKLKSEQITKAIRPEQFFGRLKNRMQYRRGGFSEVANNLHFLYDRKDYYGVYLYLVFLFGFIQWRTPRDLAVLSANPEYLKQYLAEFMKVLDEYREKYKDSQTADSDNETDDSL